MLYLRRASGWIVPIENDRRTEAMRKMAATMPPAGGHVVVVSHKPNGSRSGVGTSNRRHSRAIAPR